MRSFALLLAAVSLFTGAAAQVESSNQLVIVVAPDWNSNRGTLYLYERTDSAWMQHSNPWDVELGDSGLAWGFGLNMIPAGGPIKHEGDRRSPAGIFEFGDFYGYEPEPPAGTKFPYHESLKTLRCVDDTGSVFYNSMIDENDVVRDSLGHLPWKSAEEMRIDSGDYRYLIVIRNNPNAIPGGGSCIFLHVRSMSVPPTLGCTSMEEDRLIALMEWLDPDQHPLFVQLPANEFNRFLIGWNLPLPTRY